MNPDPSLENTYKIKVNTNFQQHMKRNTNEKD